MCSEFSLPMSPLCLLISKVVRALSLRQSGTSMWRTAMPQSINQIRVERSQSAKNVTKKCRRGQGFYMRCIRMHTTMHSSCDRKTGRTKYRASAIPIQACNRNQYCTWRGSVRDRTAWALALLLCANNSLNILSRYRRRWRT